MKAAAKYSPDVNWRANSIVTADFTCSKRKQTAIPGTDAADIFVAVFLNGTAKKPEILRFSAKVRNPTTAVRGGFTKRSQFRFRARPGVSRKL
jgi:hypothetical protein